MFVNKKEQQRKTIEQRKMIEKMIEENKYTLQFQGVKWLNKIILITYEKD
jgi:hypothetical protein